MLLLLLAALQATTHPMQYELSLPKGWTAQKRWPVVVAITDASREFAALARTFEQARGDRPYIVVVPHVMTSGGASFPRSLYSDAANAEAQRVGDFAFDEAGIAAVVRDVKSQYGGEDKYFLTGWEAGGHTVFAMLFRHPGALAAVAPVSPNYQRRWLDDASFAKATDVPVKVLFFGQVSPELQQARGFFLKQTERALDEAKAHGFRTVSLETVDKPHGPLPEAVFAFFDSTRAR